MTADVLTEDCDGFDCRAIKDVILILKSSGFIDLKGANQSTDVLKSSRMSQLHAVCRGTERKRRCSTTAVTFYAALFFNGVSALHSDERYK